MIGHFVEYLEANFVIGCQDRSARVCSVLSESRQSGGLKVIVSGWTLRRFSVIGDRLTGCSMVGLAETVERFVCHILRRMVDINDSGISIPLSLSKKMGRSRIWIASFTRREYKCRLWSMHWTPLQIGRWSASYVCSATAELSVHIGLTSLWCSSILFPAGLPVSPMYTLLQLPQGILCTIASRLSGMEECFGWTK